MKKIGPTFQILAGVICCLLGYGLLLFTSPQGDGLVSVLAPVFILLGTFLISWVLLREKGWLTK